MAEASVDDLAALEAAFAPVYAWLEEDAATAEFIARIRELEKTVDAEASVAVPAGCDGVVEATEVGGEAGDPAILNGAFQREAMTIDDLVAAGLTEEQAANVTAAFRLEFDDGAFTLTVDGEWVCDGEYTVDGAHVVVTYLPGGFCGPGGVLFEGDFTVDGAALILSDVDSQNDTDKIFFGLAPWPRVD